MMAAQLHLESVRERDVDLLLISQFLDSASFVRFFTEKIGRTASRVASVTHSYATEDGESDITVILEDGMRKTALLIEDKIDAIAMPQQHARYVARGNAGLREGRYDEFFIFITAPQAYLRSNEEAGKYEHPVSFESLLPLFPEGGYGFSLLQAAIAEKEKGYTPMEDRIVTAFWKDYYAFVADQYPALDPYIYTGPRGPQAVWPTFRLTAPGMKMQLKSDRGFMDLEISGYAAKQKAFLQANQQVLDRDMSVKQAGKSLAVRIFVPKVSFRQPFAHAEKEMRLCLDAAVRLQDLSRKLILDENGG